MILRHFPGHETHTRRRSQDFLGFHRENVVVFARAEDVSFSEHTAPLSIKFCAKGREIYHLNGVPRAVEDDKFLIINNGEPYASHIFSGETVESFCVFFQDEIEKETLTALENSDEKLLDDPFNEKNRMMPLFQNLHRENSRIVPLLRRMHKEISGGQNSQLRLDEQCHKLIEALFCEHHQTLKEVAKLPMIRPATRVEIYRRLSRARDYIESCYDEPVNLKKLSRTACLSPHHFLRLFKTVFHRTPHQYLTEIRLQKALKLVKEENDSITDICFNVGFENPSSFSRLFKNRFDLPPNEFRKKLQ